MIQLLKAIQDALTAKMPNLKYVDENWGQLDYYAQPPVQWPCCLIDVAAASFTNLGNKLQQADIVITLDIANLKLTNTSAKAPTSQKDAAWAIHQLIDELHQQLHGKRLTDRASLLYRKGFSRVKRDDGIQHYNIIYTCTLQMAYETFTKKLSGNTLTPQPMADELV